MFISRSYRSNLEITLGNSAFEMAAIIQETLFSFGKKIARKESFSTRSYQHVGLVRYVGTQGLGN